MPWHYGNGWWHMGFMWLFWLVLIVIVVWLIVRSTSGRLSTGEAQESPEEILKRRYARGEIDKDEYDRRLNDLRR